VKEFYWFIVKLRRFRAFRTHPPAPSLWRCKLRTATRKGWLFAEIFINKKALLVSPIFSSGKGDWQTYRQYGLEWVWNVRRRHKRDTSSGSGQAVCASFRTIL